MGNVGTGQLTSSHWVGGAWVETGRGIKLLLTFVPTIPGHPHQQAGVCTTSILKCTKTPPTRTVGLGKRVRFSEGSSPEPTRQRGGREEKVLSRGSDRKRRKTKTAPGTGEEKDSEPLTGVERREEGKSDEDEELEEDEYEVEAILDHRKVWVSSRHLFR